MILIPNNKKQHINDILPLNVNETSTLSLATSYIRRINFTKFNNFDKILLTLSAQINQRLINVCAFKMACLKSHALLTSITALIHKIYCKISSHFLCVGGVCNGKKIF